MKSIVVDWIHLAQDRVERRALVNMKKTGSMKGHISYCRLLKTGYALQNYLVTKVKVTEHHATVAY
jgi:hypothetical protein